MDTLGLSSPDREKMKGSTLISFVGSVEKHEVKELK